MAESRIIPSNNILDDVTAEYQTMRPKTLNGFIGHESIKENLSIFLNATKNRGETLDHVLLYGPPGLGKTTLAHIIANEMSVNISTTSGPVLAKAGDLAAILTNLQMGDILFIDEIHRLNIAVEECLYSAMEDFTLDLIIGDGPSARTIKMNLSSFTLVGATTRLGLISNPLKDRFGIPIKLDFYTAKQLQDIVLNYAHKIGTEIDHDAAYTIAVRSRGTPRVALRLLRRVRDFADVLSHGKITAVVANNALLKLNVDTMGLDELDYKYLRHIANAYNGGPVGIETIVAGISEDQTTIEETIEPYLMQMGFVSRTAKGRVLTKSCLEHINL